MSGLLSGLVLGLFSAIAINSGQFMQHGAARAAPTLSLSHPVASLRSLFTSKRWITGYSASWIGWALYIAALRFAPLSLVQASAGSGIGVVALLTHRVSGVPLSRRERAVVAVAMSGVIALGISLAHGTGGSERAHTVVIFAAVGVLLAIGLLAWAVRGKILSNGGGLGAAAGCCYAAADVASKAAVTGRGLVFVPILLICSIGGFVALQMAYQRGSALATIGSSILVGNALPIVAGLVIFHERLPSGAFGALRIAGFIAVIVGVAVISRQTSGHSAVGFVAHTEPKGDRRRVEMMVASNTERL